MSGWWEISRNVPMAGWGRVNTVRWRDSCHLDPVSVRPVLYRPADLLAVQVPVPAETHGGKPCLALSPSLSSPEFLYFTSRRGETPTQTVSDQWGQWGVPPVLSSVHSSDISQEERLTSPAGFQTSSQNNISEWRHQWGIQVNVLVSSAAQGNRIVSFPGRSQRASVRTSTTTWPSWGRQTAGHMRGWWTVLWWDLTSPPRLRWRPGWGLTATIITRAGRRETHSESQRPRWAGSLRTTQLNPTIKVLSLYFSWLYILPVISVVGGEGHTKETISVREGFNQLELQRWPR